MKTSRYRVELFLLLGSLFLVSTLPHSLNACTTFLLESPTQKIMAKSYDWNHGNGLVMVNKRHMKKAALFLTPQNSASLTSQYCSVTFNQHGREFPLGGTNEMGLAVEILWLDSSVYPKNDSRPAINELQWIQYQLDNSATVAQAIQNASKIWVKNIYAKVHYMTCDKTGSCASFEYIDGNLKIHSGVTSPIKTLTNDTYADSLVFLKKHSGFGGDLPIPQSLHSLDRFVRTASTLSQLQSANFENAYSALDSVKTEGYTQFQLVSNLTDREISFRTANNNNIRRFQTQFFDYSCQTPVLIFDMDEGNAEDITNKFEPYTAEKNRLNILRAFEGMPLGKLFIGPLSHFPDTTECQEISTKESLP